MKAILQAEQISKTYQTKTARHEALRPTTLRVHEGEFVSIMGPSGAGKSTLLNLLSTIDQPTDGSILINGADVTAMKEKQLARFRREQLGFIFQDFNLLDTMTVRENIALPLSLANVDKKIILERVDRVARQLGIYDLLDKRPVELSGGQKQRTAAARAIIHDPSLILADEPTGALDSKSATGLLEAMQSLNNEGATILMVTHDPMTASYAERILFVKDESCSRKSIALVRRRNSSNRSWKFSVNSEVPSVSLSKLAFQNLKNIRQNVMYLGAVTFAILIYYTFLAIRSNEAMLQANELYGKLGTVFTGASVILALFSAIFIWYSSDFFLRRRKKEIGLYALLGLERGQIARLIFLETMGYGVIGLILGIAIGTVASKYFVQLLASVMAMQVDATFTISGASVLQTIGVFLLIFLIIALRSARRFIVLH